MSKAKIKTSQESKQKIMPNQNDLGTQNTAGAKENHILRTASKTVAAALITAAVCMLLLFFTGLIPQTAIAESCRESARYFQEKELFPYLIDGQFNTRQDNYADCILVNILYHIDGENVPLSLIKASYYNPEMENVNVSLWDAVQETKEPNVDYFRYWHGSMVLLRPLFVFTGITGARLVLGILLLALTLLVAAILFRRGQKAFAVCWLLGNLVVQTWMCAFCIEYITTFLVMNGTSLGVIFLYEKYENSSRKNGGKGQAPKIFGGRASDPGILDRKLLVLMAVSGVTACFLDFLTTETLTVTIPILILTVLRYEDGRLESLKKEVQRMAVWGLTWGCSYGFMFLLKWGISAAVLGGQAFGEALALAGERISGAVTLGNTNLDEEATGIQRLLGALARNQGSLFPFQNEMGMGMATVLFFGALFVCFAIVYLFRDKNFSGKMILLCLILALVPYLRYAVLENHAYLHYFFTYRAQLVTVTALLYCSWRFGLQRFWRERNSRS